MNGIAFFHTMTKNNIKKCFVNKLIIYGQHFETGTLKDFDNYLINEKVDKNEFTLSFLR